MSLYLPGPRERRAAVARHDAAGGRHPQHGVGRGPRCRGGTGRGGQCHEFPHGKAVQVG